MDQIFLWLFLTLFCVIAGGFYAALEMAVVSFNKIRLQFAVSRGERWAYGINWLLQHPTRLFGTTLLGVTITMLVGSECSRRLYESMGFKPDLAPLTQVPFVLIFAELVPTFAGRRHPEHIARLGGPLLYFSARIMTPAIWIITAIARLANWLVGGKEIKDHGFISREELQMVLEARDHEPVGQQEPDELNLLARNIFVLRGKTAMDALVPLTQIPVLPSNSTVGHMREILATTRLSFVPIYHRDPSNIVAIAFARELVRIGNSQRIRDHAQSPWFITQDTELVRILQQFRRNNQRVAVVLNDEGNAIGLLTLDDLVEEIFGEMAIASKRRSLTESLMMIDKIFPGETRIRDFNAQFGVKLDSQGKETLAELLKAILSHHPEVGESINIGPFQMTVEEVSLLEVKSVRIRTR